MKRCQYSQIKVKHFLNAKISTTKHWREKDEKFACFISHDLPLDLVPVLSELGPTVAVSRRVSLIPCISGTHGVMPASVQKRHRRTISVFWFCFFFWVFGFWGLSTNEADLAWAIATFWHKRSNLIQRLSRVVVCVCFFAWKKTGSDKVDSVTETWKGRIACHRLSLKLDTGIS